MGGGGDTAGKGTWRGYDEVIVVKIIIRVLGALAFGWLYYCEQGLTNLIKIFTLPLNV